MQALSRQQKEFVYDVHKARVKINWITRSLDRVTSPAASPAAGGGQDWGRAADSVFIGLLNIWFSSDGLLILLIWTKIHQSYE